jgi:hypothetical protein
MDSRCHVGIGHGSESDCGRRVGEGRIDAPAEYRSIGYLHARRPQVAFNTTGLSDRRSLGCDDTAIDSAADRDRSRRQVRFDAGIGAEHDLMICQVDSPDDFAVDVQILRSTDIALYDDALADVRPLVSRGLRQ